MSVHSEPGSSGATPVKRTVGYLLELPSTAALIEAAAKIRDAGYTRWDCHAPIPVHGIDEAMGIRRTALPWVVFLCGLTGCLAGIALQLFTNAYNYPYLVSGKPLLSLPAFVPVAFELTILFAAFGAFLGMLVFNGLPLFYHGVFNHPRFIETATTDKFFISIEASDPMFDLARTRQQLESLNMGAVVVLEEEQDHRPPRRLVRVAVIAGLVLSSLALIPPAAISSWRAAKRDVTRVQLIPNMDQQPKFKTQQVNPLYADTRANRPQVEGTVARGEARIDDHFYRGISDGTWALTLPVPLDKALMERGQLKFNIYCAQCHGFDGYGNGVVNARAERLQEGTWVQPTSLHDAQVLERPDGHIFNTITHGIRSMPPYGDQISVRDRWAVIAYVRALQRSQNARLEDVPADRRSDLAPQ